MKKVDKNRKTVEAYDKNPQFYADKFDSYGIRIDDIDRALRLNESGSLKTLELGCGNGRDAQYIISKVGVDNYIGYDASAGLLKKAIEKNPDVSFELIDIREINVSPETVGVIFSFSFLVHMKHDDMVKLVDKCHKALKIGGILYISTKYGEYREERTSNLGDEKYYYFYTPEDIERLIDYKFFMVYKEIQDTRYVPSFTVALRKIG